MFVSAVQQSESVIQRNEFWVELKWGQGFCHSSFGKENLQCRRPQFNSWVRKIHCRKDRLPIPVFLCFPCGSAGEEFACNAGDLGSIPGLGRSPGEGKGYPLQYSGLENSTDCIIHGVTKSGTRLSHFQFQYRDGLGQMLFWHLLDLVAKAMPVDWLGDSQLTQLYATEISNLM